MNLIYEKERVAGITCSNSSPGIAAVLSDPLINRGTGFSVDDRRTLQLEGLLPPRRESLVEQAARVVANFRDKHSSLDKYCYLSGLRDENEALFYRVVLDNLDEMLPIIYTPTVGEACTQWSRIYERPRGLYISAFAHRGRVAEVLKHWPRPQASVIVATDGGRILGLGDLGANGMGIPVGKLSLYSACAGVAPELCLPIALDVGTDNTTLREDPLYLGERQARLTGDFYDEFIEEFVTAVRTVFPGAILQFEDFNNANAFRLLDRYRNTLCCFNDDVQGTGAMGLAGLYSAARITGQGLAEQRILFVGAGEANLGFARTVVAAMQHEGLTEAQSKARCLFMDSRGLVVTSRTDLPEWKSSFAQDRVHTDKTEVVIEDFAPTAIIGACGVGARFNEVMLCAMARLNHQPIVFALSNPTSKAECTAEQAFTWTQGRVVFASGSPFAPVTHEGRVYAPGQGNNFYVFPGAGLGLLLAGATQVSDEMFLAAAHALADCVSEADLEQGRLFPPAAGMRDVAVAVAAAVARVAHKQGYATRPPEEDFSTAASRYMYEPEYD